MTLRKKIILGFLTLIVLTIAAFVLYIWFTESKTRDPFTAIPDDAVYIIETTDLTEGWTTISDSKMWKHMRTNKHFEDISKSAATLDSLIKGDATMDMLFSNRQLLVSAHMISGSDYDFIFVINMKQASKVLFVKDYIKSIVSSFGYSMNKRNFEGSEIIELTDNETLEVLYITFIDNLFVGSYSPILLEKSIKQKDKNNWIKNNTFQAVAGEISSKKLFNFYFNYSLLSKFMAVYLSEESDIVNSLGNSLKFSAFNVNFEDEQLSFAGYTNLADSVSSYLKSLANISPGKADGYKIASEKTALYLAMCFDDFDDFYKNLTTEFSNEKGEQYEDYTKTVKKVEKLFKISMQDDFFSWIGNEIAFVKLKPVANSKEGDVSILIQAKDIEDARKGLDHLTSQVKKRSPLKFEEVEYKNYTINYLDIKGFFKMFFGKLFGKLERPYFTYIDNYVVFSNSPSALMDIIDDFLDGKTLEKNKIFTEFKDNFESKSNVIAFIRMPELYSHMYFYSNAEKRKGVHENKELILSFSQVGFQLVSDGKMFKTTLIVRHDEDALFNEELEKFENAAEELYVSDYDSLKFKPELTADQLKKEGAIEVKYENDKTKYEGTIRDGKIDGAFKTYYNNGNLESTVNYREGKVIGKATFYYDNDDQKIKSEMTYNENEKIEGIYTEYYENGSKKAVVEFEDGVLNGDALLYYDSGNIKIEGKYKDGNKEGKWKNYTEDGNLFDKAKWKKGQTKKKEEGN
jgi:antitoxin component YwqK of YwqJK toxin-antitoxin module